MIKNHDNKINEGYNPYVNLIHTVNGIKVKDFKQNT